jgi:hypothetical protein
MEAVTPAAAVGFAAKRDATQPGVITPASGKKPAEAYANAKKSALAYLEADAWKLEKPRFNPDALS